MPLDYQIIDIISSQLSQDLPGKQIQYEMAPLFKETYHQIPENHKTASVLALIYPKNEEWHLALMKRKADIKEDQHAGQISLPGGRLEPQDVSLEACALRESQEELGIVAKDVSILGPLSRLYVYVSQFLVYPFVGYTKYTPLFVKQKSEVEKVIEVPISYLTNPNIKKSKPLTVRGMTMPDVPYFDIYGDTLWGATAMIVNELVHLMIERRK